MSTINKEKNTIDLLMGNEAIARGAVEGGVQVATGYPGTPSSEVIDTLATENDAFDYYSEWSTNEMVAFESASGAAMVGANSLVAMKNAGLNWTMDMFMTLVYTGVRGGMVIAVADDPDAFYSSTEQDTRPLASYAKILCFEPANQQEAKDMTKKAFQMSKETELPVFLRSVTRISHSSGDVTFGGINKNSKEIGFNRHWKHPYRWNVYGPPGPVNKHKWLIERQPSLAEKAENSEFNSLSLKESKVGVVAAGIGYSFVKEAMDDADLDDLSLLKIGTSYPLPQEKLRKLTSNVEKLLVVEEGEQVVENQVREFAQQEKIVIEVNGKASGNYIPSWGEIDTDVVAESLDRLSHDISTNKAVVDSSKRDSMKEITPPRSSTLCAGCPHIGTYYGLRKALKKEGGEVPIVNGDIGCYEQGGYGIVGEEVKATEEASKPIDVSSPYEILDTIYVMGSGLGVSEGQAKAGYDDGAVVAVAGDSTFFHATLPTLVNAIYNEADLTFLVMDNRWTCMTGHQPDPVTGLNAQRNEAPQFDIKKIVQSLGVGNIHEMDAYNLNKVQESLEDAVNYSGVSVVIAQRECALQVLRRGESPEGMTTVDKEKCIGCKECVSLGCPAITFSDDKAGIDEVLCVNCGMCKQVCPVDAISFDGGSE